MHSPENVVLPVIYRNDVHDTVKLEFFSTAEASGRVYNQYRQETD